MHKSQAPFVPGQDIAFDHPPMISAGVVNAHGSTFNQVGGDQYNVNDNYRAHSLSFFPCILWTTELVPDDHSVIVQGDGVVVQGEDNIVTGNIEGYGNTIGYPVRNVLLLLVIA